MKKLLQTIVCAALCGTMALCAAACGGAEDKLTVYAPDGAPALALAGLIAGEEGSEDFDVHIVDATTIQTYVAGEAPAADFCILPVNAAGKFLGTGAVYQMLGTVTNGNLYFLKTASKELPDLTAENIADVLPGKTLGVIQYENVPGLTLRVVLEDKEIPYQTVESVDDAAADKLNILPCTPQLVAPSTKCDYYLCPEPAATSKIGATQGALALAGSLQTLYGGEEGYPQAALVAKKSVIGENAEALGKVLAYMGGAADYLKTAEASTLNALLESKREAGMAAAFTEAQLNQTVVANCSVRFTPAAACKSAVVAFLMRFKAVNPNGTELPDDAFFYAG